MHHDAAAAVTYCSGPPLIVSAIGGRRHTTRDRVVARQHVRPPPIVVRSRIWRCTDACSARVVTHSWAHRATVARHTPPAVAPDVARGDPSHRQGGPGRGGPRALPLATSAQSDSPAR